MDSWMNIFRLMQRINTSSESFETWPPSRQDAAVPAALPGCEYIEVWLIYRPKNAYFKKANMFAECVV